MESVNISNTIKNDVMANATLKLLLIIDKPLDKDTRVLFDSPIGLDYLSKCFKSKYKSINTHITCINDTKDNESFSQKTIYKILNYYKNNHLLDIKNIVIAFVGQNTLFDMCNDCKANHVLPGTSIDTTQKIVRLFSQNLSMNFIDIPYVVLPNATDLYEEGTLIENLNNLKSLGESNIKYKTEVSPYSTVEEMLSRLATLEKLYDEKILKCVKINGKYNRSVNKLDYFSVFDLITNSEVIYCPTDEICKDDDIELKSRLFKGYQKLFKEIEVYDVTGGEILTAFGIKDKVKLTTEEFIEKSKVKILPATFDIIEISTGKSVKDDPKYSLVRRGVKSQWYEKWKNEVYYKVDPNELKVTNAEYPDLTRYEWIYDIEVFKYDFLLVAYSMDKRFKVVCWNAFEELEKWIKDKILIGFNNAAYDDNVVKYAIARHKILKENKVDASEKDLPSVKAYSDMLINDEKFSDKNIHNNSPFFISWDVSFHMPFDIRRNSLKKLTMSVLNRKNYDSNVPFDIQRALTQEERDDVEKYCALDVDNTISLYLPDPADIEVKKENPKHKCREFAQESYDIKWNLIITYKMRARTLINKSSSFAGKVLCGEDAKPNIKNTWKEVDGKKVYYSIPDLAMKELAGTELLDFYLKNQTNPNYITEKYEVYMGGNDESHKYQFGFGGLHQALVGYGSKNLVNMDVASLYPSLLIQYNLMSRGAARNPDSYKEVYATRIEAKHNGNTLLNQGLKLILNGAIGAMLSEYNPLYDTWSNSSICVHGQLLVFILAKRLFDAGLNIVQTNTDGIMIETKEGVDHMAIAEQWMKETRLVLEFDEIAILQQNNVNNYYCQFTNGKVKSKGFYLSNEKYGKATSKILCNIVTERPLYEGVVPKDYVIFKKHSIGEIYDAKTRTKLEGRSLAFVVGYEDDPETGAYYSRSKNERWTVVKDEKGHKIPELDANGNQVLDEKGQPKYKMEQVHSESKINGFTDHMLLVDDMNNLDINRINTKEYVAFAKNLLDREEEFGPYYTENFVKVEEPDVFQALNMLKDNTDQNPKKNNTVCQNFLFECDYLSREEQEEIIERIKPYIYRVVWSGHRSYHIIMRLNHPVTSLKYKQIWYYLKNKLHLAEVDEAGAGLPNKYTRVPGQINPSTGLEQTLYIEPKNIIDADEILDNLPRVKEEIKPPKEYKGKVTIEALKKHIEKQEWTEGNRFSSVQKLSPVLISQVSLEELLTMIPCKLNKDHIYVLRCKYSYYEKYIKNRIDSE